MTDMHELAGGKMSNKFDEALNVANEAIDRFRRSNQENRILLDGYVTLIEQCLYHAQENESKTIPIEEVIRIQQHVFDELRQLKDQKLDDKVV